jgi:hypothetical protein
VPRNKRDYNPHLSRKFIPADSLRSWDKRAPGMAKRNYTAEEIVAVFGQVKALMANGKAKPQACREVPD